jgi:formylmethanofuran dehydrogenase subunit D
MREYEIELKETAEGELFFRIPDEVLERLGWKEGDDLKFEERNGSVLIRKIKYENIMTKSYSSICNVRMNRILPSMNFVN